MTDISQSEGEFIHHTNIDPAREIRMMANEGEQGAKLSLKTIEQEILDRQMPTTPGYRRKTVEIQQRLPTANQQQVYKVGQSIGEIQWKITHADSKMELSETHNEGNNGFLF